MRFAVFGGLARQGPNLVIQIKFSLCQPANLCPALPSYQQQPEYRTKWKAESASCLPEGLNLMVVKQAVAGSRWRRRLQFSQGVLIDDVAFIGPSKEGGLSAASNVGAKLGECTELECSPEAMPA